MGAYWKKYGSAKVKKIKKVVTRISKASGNTGISIPTTKKANSFILAMVSPSAGVLMWNDETSKLDYYEPSAGNVSASYDVTVTYNDNSIEISAFNFSSGAYYFLATIEYLE